MTFQDDWNKHSYKTIQKCALKAVWKNILLYANDVACEMLSSRLTANLLVFYIMQKQHRVKIELFCTLLHLLYLWIKRYINYH